MKFSLSWLKTHLETDASLGEITDRLTGIGLELEGVEDRGAALAPFVIAEVIEARPHPNADRLRACQVNTGTATVSVVCGAPNARTGMKGVFAPPGSFIPGTGITLKVGEIRGVQSAGMLLSAREMGLGDDHSGIIDLPEDAPVGASYAGWAGLDDPVIDIAVTPNRGDALSVRGVARDLAAAGLGGLIPWSPAPVPARFASRLRWRIDMPETCPWVLGRHFTGLHNGPSPAWLAERLRSVGLRPINALVDITNFFTVDLGRPLHVFDAAKLRGGILTLRPGRDETFSALDGRDYVCTAEDCVIADAAGVQSLAGVMGGAASGCDDGTTEMFLECALFDPVRVALTGRRHGLTSDARQRFERGIDPALLPMAMEAASAMVLELCGGTASEVVADGAEPDWQRDATLRFSRLRTLGGVDVPADEAVGALERLGFAVRQRDTERVTVAVPSWRNDVAGSGALDLSATLDAERADAVAAGVALMEPEADLVEEVFRLRGLDTIPPVSLPRAAAIPARTLTRRQGRTALARRVLAAQGLTECVTFSFLPSEVAEKFGGGDPSLRLTNPIAADLDALRPTPLATLALAAQRNFARGLAACGLFEIGPAFTASTEDGQSQVAAALRRGPSPRHWLQPARPVDAMDAKADALAVLAALGVPMEAVTATADAAGHYHPGRSGVLRQGPKLVLARFGELHPGLLAALDLPGPAVGVEIFLAAIADPKQRRRAAPDLPPFQPVARDFAFLVDRTVTADAVLRAARGAERTLIAGVMVFDVFEGESLPAGKKSIGLEVTFQPREHTLAEAELQAASGRVVAAVARATGAALRG